MPHPDPHVGLRLRRRRREAVADHRIDALRRAQVIAGDVDVGALRQQVMQARRALVPVMAFEARVLVARDEAQRRRELVQAAAFVHLHVRRLAEALDRRVRVVGVERQLADRVAGADAERALAVDVHRRVREQVGARAGRRIDGDGLLAEERVRADHRVRIERVDAVRVVQARVRGADREVTLRETRARAPCAVAMEVARDVAERVHRAELEAAQVVRQELHRVRQAVAVEAVEVALVDRVAAAPRRDVVDRYEFVRDVELVAERQRAPVVLQADIRLPAEFRAAEAELPVAEMEAALEREHGLQAAAQVFGALEAEAVPVGDAVVELDHVRTARVVHVRDTRVENPVQRHAALRMSDGGNTGRACKRGGYGNFRMLHYRPPSLNRSMDRISSRRVPRCAGGFEFRPPRWLRYFVFRNNAAIGEKYKPIFQATRLKATLNGRHATDRENT
ncbi:hypothetical protein BO443_70136 [Burkholderia orbicola]